MEIVTVLASNSPRRKQLFKELCPSFTLLPADTDESVGATLSPKEVCAVLSERKARAGFEKALLKGLGEGKRVVVLGSDTVVAFEGKILGKPKDEEDAKGILRMLSGKVHEVYTGVCFFDGEKSYVQTERTQVLFKDLSEGEIAAYVATGSPLDKAGAYGIQDGAVVKSYEGSYTNVVGLPVELTKRMYEEVRKC